VQREPRLRDVSRPCQWRDFRDPLEGFAEQQAKYLPKMVSGEWLGTMNLTEPHCGTDLGLIRTRAEPQADGSYAITGTKIFISAGDHDLTENIIHLVLAKTPGAPDRARASRCSSCRSSW
jgi:alkylation response protein AidB-like acyl-CoA dehydrogenase